MYNGVTIGQAAAFVGITIKTVRHYHRLGLVTEPRRDGSGYRRYESDDLLRLVQVRTLAAGVPLAEIGPLLDADSALFASEPVQVERQLDEHIAEPTTRRAMPHRLADGDRALLPDRAVTLLERMLVLGHSEDEVAATREGWVQARALDPEGFDDYLTQFERAMQDTRLIALTRRIHGTAVRALRVQTPRRRRPCPEVRPPLTAKRTGPFRVTGRSHSRSQFSVCRGLLMSRHASQPVRTMPVAKACSTRATPAEPSWNPSPSASAVQLVRRASRAGRSAAMLPEGSSAAALYRIAVARCHAEVGNGAEARAALGAA